MARYKTWPDVSRRRWSAIPRVFWARMHLGNASGGTNWPGAGYDPETHIVYAQANQSAVLTDLAPQAAGGLLGYSLRPRQE